MTTAVHERPARTFKSGPVTVWIRRASLALTIICTITLIGGFWTLSETIPTHFNFKGEADAWGSRGSIWSLIAIFTGIGIGMNWLSRHPRIVNYPAIITTENAQQLYRAGEQLLVWITASCTLIYVGITASVLWGMNASILLVPALIGMFASLIAGLAKMLKA